MSYRKRIALALGTAFLLPCMGAQAAGKWEFAPNISLGAMYSDNYFLDVGDNKTDVLGADLDAQLAFRNTGPRSTFEIAPRLSATYFPDEHEAESNDYFLDVDYEFLTQRVAWRMRGEYAHEKVVESEMRDIIPDADLGESVGGGGERISVQTERDMIRLRPSFSFQWTERMRFEADARMYKVDYDEAIGGEIPFTDLSSTVGLAFRTSQLSQLAARATISQFKPDTGTAATDRIGAELQWTKESSKTARFYLRGGFRRSEFGSVQGASATGFVGGIGGSWRREVSRVLIDLIRAVEPSAGGNVVNRDELRFQLERRISERTKAFFQARGVQTKTSFRDVADTSLTAAILRRVA